MRCSSLRRINRRTSCTKSKRSCSLSSLRICTAHRETQDHFVVFFVKDERRGIMLLKSDAYPIGELALELSVLAKLGW
jgi:hypothetical protein